jgi:hypothetical protein
LALARSGVLADCFLATFFFAGACSFAAGLFLAAGVSLFAELFFAVAMSIASPV